jgi:FixJ family two-component response regulator
MTSTPSNLPLIAIVDDDALVRIAICRLVRSLGYRAHAYESAEDFLQSPEKRQISCVICDIQLPCMNGLELQRQLKTEDGAPPIIFMTAYPDGLVRDQALAAGATCFLNKPLDGHGLEQWLEKAHRR